MKNRIREFYALEQLSGGDTCVHRLHPTMKLLATTIFIVTVVSFDRYDFGRMVPYIFYPTLMTAFSETPYTMLMKKFLIALPFCIFVGISNVIFDRASAFSIYGITVSYGAVSFFTILFRAYLCVMAVLILVSVTPVPDITNSMRRLKLPYIFIVMFEMTYRYIGVLFDEAYSMYIAYSLRSADVRGIALKDTGGFVGQLLLRSFDRADRIYNAMKCRGYALRNFPRDRRKYEPKDLIFCSVTCLFCAAFRVFSVKALLGGPS